MVEDMTHLKVLHDLAEELQAALTNYNQLCSGQTDKTALLALRLEQNEVLAEIVRKQRRHLKFMNGEKIEPEAHFVEATMIGFGGLNAQ